MSTGGLWVGDYSTAHAESLRVWSLFTFVTLSMSLAVSAGNLLLLVLSIECVLDIQLYLGRVLTRRINVVQKGGVKYFLYGSVASALMLYGMSLLTAQAVR